MKQLRERHKHRRSGPSSTKPAPASRAHEDGATGQPPKPPASEAASPSSPCSRGCSCLRQAPELFSFGNSNQRKKKKKIEALFPVKPLYS